MIAPARPSQKESRSMRPATRLPVDAGGVERKPSVLTRSVANHPGVVLATALAVGVALGWLVKRKMQ